MKGLWLIALLCPVIGFAQGYEVKKVSLENSRTSTICPIVYKDGLVYMNNKKSDFVRTVKDASSSFPFNLYYAKIDSSNKVQGKELFAKELTTPFNDGPAQFFLEETQVVYSRNNQIGAVGNENTLRSLGLFFSEQMNGVWTNPEPFPFNSDEYNITHPAINETGDLLVFSSDMPGSFGGADLFYSRKKGEQWSDPKNLGKHVNTEGDELFPSFFNNRLYFSTAGRSDEEDLNIWFVNLQGEIWSDPVQLDESLNSEADDFGITFRKDGRSGFFTSNRDGKDAIYSFERTIPSFDNCPPQKRISYCYLIEEYNMLDESGMPLKFKWDLGDGTTAEGYRVKHCYDSVGSYLAKLNVVDTLSGEVFYEVSEVLIEILPEDAPYIVCSDSVPVSESIPVKADLQWMTGKAQDVFWRFEDSTIMMGEEIAASFPNEGEQVIQLAVLDQAERSRCVSRKVKVKNGQIVSADVQTDPVQEGPHTNPDSLSFSVQIHQSERPTDLKDSIFDDVNYPIKERLMEDSLYHYSVGESDNMSELYPLYREMKGLGLDSKLISYEKEKELAIEEFSEQTIYFGVSSDSITPYNLSMLKLMLQFVDDDERLLIQGFADVTGDLASNIELSRKRAAQVGKFFEQNGIASNRIKVEAKGEAGGDSESDNVLKFYRKVVVTILPQ